jgi:hypothetical protein
MRNGRRGIRFAFGVRHSYGSNGHEFNVINLLCSYSPRLLLRPETTTLTTLTLQPTTQAQPKWQSNSRQPATRPNASSAPSSIPSPTNTTPHPSPSLPAERKARQGRQPWQGTKQGKSRPRAQLHCFVSFRFVSFRFTPSCPHHTTPRPAEPSHSHTLPFPFLPHSLDSTRSR